MPIVLKSFITVSEQTLFLIVKAREGFTIRIKTGRPFSNTKEFQEIFEEEKPKKKKGPLFITHYKYYVIKCKIETDGYCWSVTIGDDYLLRNALKILDDFVKKEGHNLVKQDFVLGFAPLVQTKKQYKKPEKLKLNALFLCKIPFLEELDKDTTYFGYYPNEDRPHVVIENKFGQCCIYPSQYLELVKKLPERMIIRNVSLLD